MSTTPVNDKNARPGRAAALRRWWWVPVAAVVIGGLGLLMLGGGERPDATTAQPVFNVARGPLTVSVLTSGTISSAEAVTIKSEVEGRNSILSIVDEGKQVKEGDLLIELDSSTLEDKRIDQEISVQNQEAAYVQAREALEVARKQAEADVEAAQVDYDLAELDLEKYTEGEYKQQMSEAQSKITLAEAELQQAREKLQWSDELLKEGYITQTEYDADRLSEQKARLDLELARGELKLLEEFTKRRRLAELQSGVDQKKFLLTKTKHKAASSIVEAEAVLRSKETQLRREQEKLEKIIDQIAKCKIHAPVDGMVVYATSGSNSRRDQPPLEEGIEVTERQELITMPTAQGMKAEVKIHESMLQKVSVGLPVVIKTEALPRREFHGEVTRIALLPDAQSRWLNPDLKVYSTDIEIRGGDVELLRPGMSCSAEIVVDQFDDTLYVPLQAVLRVGGKPTVYVPGKNGPEARVVEVGLDDNRMVQILSGVSAGEAVLLTPPLREAKLASAGGEGRPRLDRAGGPKRPKGPGKRDAGAEKPAERAASDEAPKPARPEMGRKPQRPASADGANAS